MKNKHLGGCLFAAALLLIQAAGAHAVAAPELQQAGHLRVAVYADFPPYSNKGKGIDVALGKELAKRLGLEANVVEYKADEDMNDDLRNMVWKGHYLGMPPADVMLHVPVDARLAEKNDKVKIFGPYHLESVAVARNPERVPPVAGSAAAALEVFTREKIGVETGSMADTFLLSVLNGRLRENVVHFHAVGDAVKAMQAGDVAAVMGTRTEVEAAVGKDTRYQLSPVIMPELRIKGWPLGMAVKAESTELTQALSSAMMDIQRDGTLDRIFADYGVTRQVP